MLFILEVIHTDRIFREDDGAFVEDVVYPTETKMFKTLNGLRKVFNYWSSNQFAAVELTAKDQNGNTLGKFIRDANGNILINKGLP